MLAQVGQREALGRAGEVIGAAAETLAGVEDLASALGILSAMITPAVLIAACGSLIIATSNRLGRVIDRARAGSAEFRAMAKEAEREGAADDGLVAEERILLHELLDKTTHRAALLQRAMTQLYLALSAFVLTSVAIGAEATTRQDLAWIPLGIGLLGAAFLFWATVLLILESRAALVSVDDEMAFIRRLGRHHAPPELRARPRTRRDLYRRHSDEV